MQINYPLKTTNKNDNGENKHKTRCLNFVKNSFVHSCKVMNKPIRFLTATREPDDAWTLVHVVQRGDQVVIPGSSGQFRGI